MNAPSPKYLPLLFLPLSGDVSDVPVQEEEPIVMSRECSNTSIEDAIDLIRSRAGKDDTIQIMLPAGPNRTRNQRAAIELANGLSEVAHGISFEVKVDVELGETSNQEDITAVHSFLDERVHFHTTEQPTGTSYTEAAFSVLATSSSDLVLLAHNRFYQWRLVMAAQNAVEADEYGQNLDTVYVLCHDENPLPGNLGKEALSFLLDRGTDLVGGHDLVMETSEGGMRLARVKAYVHELLFSFQVL